MVPMAPVKALAPEMAMALAPVTVVAMDPGMAPGMVHVRPPGLRYHDRGECHCHHHHRLNRLHRRLRTTGGRTRYDHWMSRIRSNRVPRRLGEDDDLDKTWLS